MFFTFILSGNLKKTHQFAISQEYLEKTSDVADVWSALLVVVWMAWLQDLRDAHELGPLNPASLRFIGKMVVPLGWYP